MLIKMMRESGAVTKQHVQPDGKVKMIPQKRNIVFYFLHCIFIKIIFTIVKFNSYSRGFCRVFIFVFVFFFNPKYHICTSLP